MSDTTGKGRGLPYLLRSLKKLRRTSKSMVLLGAAFGASLLTTAAIVWMIVAAPATGLMGQARTYLFVLVGLNFVLLSVLFFVVTRRVVKIALSRKADAGARLHLRFVSLFALAAVVPAVIVASFFVFLNRGIDNWFSDRVRDTVENSALIAKTYMEEQLKSASAVMEGIHYTLDTDEARATFTNRLDFSTALQNMLNSQSQLSAIYVINRSGEILARAELPDAPPYSVPPADVIADVVAQGPYGYIPSGSASRHIHPLEGYDGALLYGVSPLPEGLYEKAEQASVAINEYRDTIQSRGRTQFVFILAYIEAVMLVLIAAIWVGTSAAERIAVPVARLVQAAGRVSSGDLNARVMVTHQSEDIAVLSRAFNHMTHELQEQQLALKSASEEAETRRHFIETVLSEISAGIIGLDDEGRISAINRHAANFIGFAAEEALGAQVHDLVPEIGDLLLMLSTHRVEEQEVDLIRRGETRRIRVRGSGLADGGAVLTFDDITRLVAAQRNAAWKDVARRIAHEIKNPLTPIQLSAERLRRKYRDQIQAESETFDRLTDTIIRHVGDIGRMVDEFSSFARMPAPNFAEEEAAELVRAAVFAQRVARQDVEISMVEPLPDIKVVCDGRMLSQALGNVLKNGGEAITSRLSRDGADVNTKSNTPVGRLRVEMRHDDEFVVIEVEDDGIGLPEKDRDRLTEPYVTTREKGTGLGLAIVKRILEDHGGEFYLADAIHLSGARAVLKLPRLQAGRAPAANEPVSGTRLVRT